MSVIYSCKDSRKFFRFSALRPRPQHRNRLPQKVCVGYHVRHRKLSHVERGDVERLTKLLAV